MHNFTFRNSLLYGLFWLFSFLSMANFAFAADQTNSITGRITDEQGAAVVGATVSILNTSSATSTDANGNYVLSNRSEEHTSELQSRENLVCRLLLEKKNI